MSNKKGKVSFVRIVFSIFLLLLLLVIISFFAKFTNNFTSDFKSFYVQIDGKTIMNDTDGISIVKDNEYRIDVGYSLDFLNSVEELGYHVQVLPNITETTDFGFTADGENYRYSDISDLTEFFEIDEYNDYFTFKAVYNLPEIVQSICSGKELSEIPTAFDTYTDYFKLVVSSEDYSISINIAFNLISSGGIRLQPNRIIF